MVVIAVVAALLAGASFAVAGVLQQRVATQAEHGPFRPGLLLELARQPLWLAGIGAAVLSYGFQSLALAFGPLSLVQSVLVAELIFAVPLSARIHRVRIGWRTWAGALMTSAGLALALLSAAPRGGDPEASLTGWAAAVGAAAGLALVAVLLSRFTPDLARASLVALAAGVVMGTQSALLDATVEQARHGVVPLLTSWQSYLFAAASIVGLLLIQSAYESGPLAASLPVFDTVEPMVAVTLGIALFGEAVDTDPLSLALTIVGVGSAVIGIITLDRAPAIRALHQQESQEKTEAESTRSAS